jgi:trehalose utilization protein
MDRRLFVRRAAWAAAGVWGLGLGTRPGRAPGREPGPVRVRVWCEGTAPRSIYPDDVDGVLGDHLRGQPGLQVARARLDQPEAGLGDAALEATDVLVWWGRLRHDDVPDARARAIVERVKAGRLGLVALHASCASKPFRALMGTSCEPGSWRDDGRPEHVVVRAPGHPIAHGVEPFTIPKTSMYAEPFEVPPPEAVVFVSSWDRGETFRSGLTWAVGAGRVAYFRPGNDQFPVLFHPSVQRIVANAVRWAAPRG